MLLPEGGARDQLPGTRMLRENGVQSGVYVHYDTLYELKQSTVVSNAHFPVVTSYVCRVGLLSGLY